MGRDTVDWIKMDRNKVQWWALVKTVMNIRIQGIS
jgi:hypothetical protein